MKGIMTLLLVLPLIANAEVYRWQDAEGNWHFGDQPPQEQHEKMDIKAPPKSARVIASGKSTSAPCGFARVRKQNSANRHPNNGNSRTLSPDNARKPGQN